MGSAWARPAFFRYRAGIDAPPDNRTPLGVCSWSLRPESPAQLASLAGACEVSSVQLHLDPIRTGDWDLEETRDTLLDAGLRPRSGMMTMLGEDYTTLESIARTGGVRPDETWAHNLGAAHANAEIARRLGIDLVTFHAGFLPEPGSPERAKIVERINRVADAFSARGVRVALETGQESPEDLLTLLGELGRDDIGVNFDPANMILYASGDPVTSLEALAPRVSQVHLKDADPPEAPGQWGTERPLGQGSVDWAAFFRVLGDRLGGVGLMIERESGEDRVGEIRGASSLARRLAPSLVS